MGIIEKIIEKPVENLIRANVGPPRREVLLLYHDYLKFANCINWNHPDGTPWKLIIKASIRAEFEAAEEENDPFLQSQLLLTWRDALDELRKKFNHAQHDLVQRIHNERNDPHKTQ